MFVHKSEFPNLTFGQKIIPCFAKVWCASAFGVSTIERELA